MESEPVRHQAFELERQRYEAALIVSEWLRRYARYSTDEVKEELIHILTHEVLSEKVVEKTYEIEATATASVEFPASWWQCTRGVFLPKWWLRRRPVRCRTIQDTVTRHARLDFTQEARFPASTIKTPERYRGPILVRREELNITEWSNNE